MFFDLIGQSAEMLAGIDFFKKKAEAARSRLLAC